MPLHLRALISFGAVAGEGSFSRAAQKMGVTQSWVSEQVRGLEDYLGFDLLVRSGRQLKLTAEGAALYPYAQQMTQLRDDAEACAARMKSSRASQLRVGSVPSTAEMPLRLALVERFVAKYERVQFELVEDNVPRLIDRLQARELDVLLLYDRGYLPAAEVDILKLDELHCCVLLPQEDPLSSCEAFPVAAFQDRSVVFSPGRQDPQLMEKLQDVFSAYGARFVTAPEHNRRTIERYARLKRLAAFRWRAPGRGRRELGDMVLLPLDEEIAVDFVAVRNRGLQSRNLKRFWQLASSIAAGAVEPEDGAGA